MMDELEAAMIEDLAKRAHVAASESLGGRGNWEDLNDTMRNVWRAVARSIWNHLTSQST
jgi:hypothetical protein